MQLLGVAIFVLILIVSIALHEFGHYLPAKRFNVHLPQFSIGFGPKIFSRQRGETLWTLRALPLGGFVRLSGMYPHGEGGSALAQAARRVSQEETQQQPGRAFWQLSPSRRLVVMLGGPVMNLFLAALFLVCATSVIGVPTPSTTLEQVVSCLDQSPAPSGSCSSPSPSLDRLRAGDQVVSLDGSPVVSWATFSDFLTANPGRTVTLGLRAPNGSQRTEQLTIATLGSGPSARGALGIRPVVQLDRVEPMTALNRVGSFVTQTAAAFAMLPADLLTQLGGGEKQSQASGVIAVGAISGQIASADVPLSWRVSTLLLIGSSVNVALFVFNLIPLPPLDGGHAVVALGDAFRNGLARLRRRSLPHPVDAARLLPLTYSFAACLLALALFIAWSDIVTLVG